MASIRISIRAFQRLGTASVITGVVVTYCALSVGVARADFNYPNFSSVAGLTFNGNASQTGGNLRLTPNLEGQAGTTWYSATKPTLAAGFDTSFTFRMDGDYGSGGGDGMAFVIQDSSTAALGGGGSGLGYAGIARCLAVEMDTFGFDLETYNHVSIQTQGTNGNSADDTASLAQHNAAPDLNDGQVHTLRIRYRPGLMLVFLDAIPAPILNIALDLQSINGESILDGSGRAWVGFSAGTGLFYQFHDVTSWNFDETSEPMPSGACCILNGCVQSNARDCETTIGGHYGGDGTDCGTINCAGACCYIEGCFWPATIQNCAAEPGTFMGVGSECLQILCSGACCTPNGLCKVIYEFDCLNDEQGIFHGANTSCVPFSCPLPSLGGCCNDNECLMKTQAECATGGGQWRGQGTLCTDVNCFDEPGPFGACCQPDTTCVAAVTQLACEHFNGTYNGDASLCLYSNCSGACDWNAATNFSSVSNPTGPWSYGSRASLNDTSLTVYPSFTTSLPFSQSGPLSIWYLPDASSFGVPFVMKNESATNVTIDSGPPVIVPAGRMMLHPGPSPADQGVDSFSVVRWTSPVAGACQVSATFYGMDIGATDVHIVHNGASIFDDVRSGVGDDRSFAGAVTVAAGDTLDFVVGRNGDESFDSTGLDVCIDVVQGGACDCAGAMPITGTVFIDDTTTGAPNCSMTTCAAATGNSPAKIYAVTLAQGGQCLINTCNGNNFNTVITVHSGCPMTAENLVTCDDDDACAPGSQVFFCAAPGFTYYVRVGGVSGASGDYSLFVYDYGSRILEGPFQNPANGHWYYITANGTWVLNEQLAIAKGGHLATINDAAENEWVRSTFTAINNNGVLIGINDAAVEGTFAWPNGDAVTYTNWDTGQPDDAGGNEDYGFLKTDGKWLDQTYCPIYYSFGEAVIEVNTVTLPGLIAGPIFNPANCNNYYFTQPGTWLETQLKAQAMGGNLVTINNAAENEFVRATFGNYGGNGQAVWIGLRDTVTEGTFFWADGTPVSYTNWSSGEPNNIGNEDYVSLNDWVFGGWNDQQGGGPLSGVIEVNGSCVVGDMNCSGSVTVADIPIFISALLGTPGFPGCNIDLADINGDTLRNGRDIRPFVGLLVP